MNGILLIDKPAGMTSHSVVSKLRKKLNTKKIGHAGTLDPSATGLLIICVGYATKVSGYLTDSNKTYQTRFIMGKTTNSYDLEGEIVSEKNAQHITQSDIEAALVKFEGDILQKPPIYSAIKINGKKLYQYARSNTEVEISSRPVTIHALKLLDFKNPIGILEMKCSKGTYVRSLVHDLGEILNVGACVDTIHRIESSPFSIKNAVSLAVLLEMDLTDIQKRMISVRDALASNFTRIEVSKNEEFFIRNGIEMVKSDERYGLSFGTLKAESLILFVSKEDRCEIAIAKWGEKKTISYLRIL
jgi:tRNA pseudouridine55 synthase